MIKSLQNIFIIVIVAVILIFIFGLAIFLIPLSVLISFLAFISEYRFKLKFKKYLLTIDGTKFFCYNNKVNSHSYIKENIIPVLPAHVELIYLNGRKPISKFEEKYISYALHTIKDRKGFPYLMKVSDGKIYDKSINNEFYNTKQ